MRDVKFGDFFSVKVKRDHNKLVNEALDVFQKAEDKMLNAIEQINDDIEDEKKAIKEAEQRIADSECSKGRLNRVLDRLKALTE